MGMHKGGMKGVQIAEVMNMLQTAIYSAKDKCRLQISATTANSDVKSLLANCRDLSGNDYKGLLGYIIQCC